MYGHTSPPFASFRGTVDEPDKYRGTRRFLLLYLPENRVLATLPSFGEVKALAACLARDWRRQVPPGKTRGGRRARSSGRSGSAGSRWVQGAGFREGAGPIYLSPRD